MLSKASKARAEEQPNWFGHRDSVDENKCYTHTRSQPSSCSRCPLAKLPRCLTYPSRPSSIFPSLSHASSDLCYTMSNSWAKGSSNNLVSVDDVTETIRLKNTHEQICCADDLQICITFAGSLRTNQTCHRWRQHIWHTSQQRLPRRIVLSSSWGIAFFLLSRKKRAWCSTPCPR